MGKIENVISKVEPIWAPSPTIWQSLGGRDGHKNLQLVFSIDIFEFSISNSRVSD
jgi:hypothetical protein